MKKIKNLFEKIHKQPEKILVNILYRLPIISHKIPDDKYLKIIYKSILKKDLNLDNPTTFNEKLQWLKLNDRNPEYTKMVDKYEVKEYVSNIIGKEHIIPLIGVWDKFEDIDFEKLPNQFVLKCTHDTGGIVICKNKSELNLKETKKKIKKSLKRNFYYYGREWPYKDVKPRIIAEKYMVDESGTELKDYKIFCFDGKAKFILVDFGRFSRHYRNIYDLNWNLLELQIKFPRNIEQKINKPDNLEEMINLAERLSKDIPHVRVDFYNVNGKNYFGELTFFHGSGFTKIEPEGWDEKIGEYLKLPKLNNRFEGRDG